MTLPAIPKPKALTPAEVDAIAERVIAWAQTAQDLDDVCEGQARIAALETYLERRDPAHAEVMRWAARQLDKRVGQLLPPTTTEGRGRPPKKIPTSVFPKTSSVTPRDGTEFRRMARYARVWDPWSVDNGAATRLAVLRVIDDHRAEAGRRARTLDADERHIDVPDDLEPITGDGWTVIPGDFRAVIPRLAAASVDLIVTDPPYSDEALEVWSELGRLAAHILVPQGILVALTGQIMLPSVIERVSASLHYGWVYAQLLPGSHSRILARHVTQAWKPWLAFSHGPWPSGRIAWHDDLLPSSARKKEHSTWQQQMVPARYLIDQLAPPNGVVCDPMLGTGTYALASRLAGRTFLGIEADRDRLKATIDRLGEA